MVILTAVRTILSAVEESQGKEKFERDLERALTILVVGLVSVTSIGFLTYLFIFSTP